MAIKKLLLGDMLIAEGLISPGQRDDALAVHKRTGKRLGQVLISRGLVTDEMIAETLSKQLGLPYRDLAHPRINADVLKLLPLEVAKKHKVLPLDLLGGKLLLAMSDPLDVFAIDDIKSIFKSQLLARAGKPGELEMKDVAMLSVEVFVASETKLLRTLERFYTEVGEEESPAPSVAEAVAEAEETPVVKLANSILSQAVDDRASDIHIEVGASGMRVRFRIDGILHEVMTPPINLQPGLVSRIKILAGMDIAEKRVPQDGRFNTKIKKRDFDIRASTLPTMYGEKLELRLLEKTGGLPELLELGFSEEGTLKTFDSLIHKPHGFIAATGPTGCGKTTTMYVALDKISTVDKNIITVEDPIEYNLGGINQVQVNPRAGLTFASGLRSILRQDPDVIMIGEIRDLETASIAMHAALTGHLVMSTLHTNEAIGAIARLLDMGIEPFIITSSLVGVLGQRLIRKLCPECKVKTTIAEPIFEQVGVTGAVDVYRAGGCPSCRHTGYFGREGLFELLVVSEPIKKLIIKKASEDEMREHAQSEGFRTMRQEGLLKVLDGVTTLEEVLRVSSGVIG